MSGSRMEWVIKPSAQIGARLGAAAGRAEPAVRELAQYHAKRGEAAMKAERPWTDRTSNAVQSLFGVAEGTDIRLGGTQEYIPYLELGTSRMSAYSVIRPVANRTAAEYFEDAAKLVDGLLGGGR